MHPRLIIPLTHAQTLKQVQKKKNAYNTSNYQKSDILLTLLNINEK